MYIYINSFKIILRNYTLFDRYHVDVIHSSQTLVHSKYYILNSK